MEKYKGSGDKALKKKEYQEAIGHYLEALEQPVPEGSEEIRHKIYANLSGAYHGNKNYRKALENADKAIQIEPKFARAYQRKGAALEWSNRLPDALAAYKQGAELDSAMCGTNVTELERKMEDNRSAHAERTAAAAAEATLISEAKQFHDAGNKAFKKAPADIDQAVLEYTKAIEIGKKDSYPDLYIVYCNRATCYYKQDKFQEALDSADKCLELNPNYMKGYTIRGDSLKKLERHEESRVSYLKALQLDRTNDNLKAAIQAEDKTLASGEHADESANITEEDDHYKVLGVEHKATNEEINKAYKKLSRRWHPDRNPGDIEAEKITRKINFAKDVLMNPVKRRAYDSMGDHGLSFIEMYGEDKYLTLEKTRPYVCPVICCLCVFSIPTLCYCCCCCCCFCAPCRKEPDEGEYDDTVPQFSDDEDDIEAGMDSKDSPPGTQRD